MLNSFPAIGDKNIGDFCRLLIAFANNLDPANQARQNVGPDLDPNCLTSWWYSWQILFYKFNFEKENPQKENMQNFPTCKELN